jgi:D-beta-D-heptose 7-phosphate kinase/D-beta-D-heptose 1-phosphate adenosyltransferase
MSASDLAAILTRAGGRRVLVVGDLMLDHFVVGRVERISPEAPVPVVTFDSEEYRLGGAANVAHNVRAMGARVEIVGVLGRDPDGARLRSALDDAGISTAGLVEDAGRCTTRKLRVVTTRNQQVARIDYEHDRPLAGETPSRVIAAIRDALDRADVVLISDYQKGVVSADVAGAAIAGARESVLLTHEDPKVPHIDYYAGASLVTPNHHEAESITLMRIRTSEDARAAAQRFRARAVRERAHHARGARHVAARRRRRVRSSGGSARSLGRNGGWRHGDRDDGRRARGRGLLGGRGASREPCGRPGRQPLWSRSDLGRRSSCRLSTAAACGLRLRRQLHNYQLPTTQDDLIEDLLE